MKNLKSYAEIIFDRFFLENKDSVMLINSQGIITAINPKFTEITGYEEEETIGKTPHFLRAPEKHPDEFYKNIWTIVTKKGKWSGEVFSQDKNGNVYLSEVYIILVKDSNTEENVCTISIMKDINERRQYEENLRDAVLRDSLTGLPNCILLFEHLDLLEKNSQRSGVSFAILFISINNFKKINNLLGRNGGDSILIKTAEKLTYCIRGEDIIARYSSNEFIVIISEVKETREVAIICGRIILEFNSTVSITDTKDEVNQINIALNIGVAVYPNDGSTKEKLIRNSEIAMEDAKKKNEGGYFNSHYRFFNSEMRQSETEREKIIISIRDAFYSDEFMLYYQPKVDKECRIIGVEALLRWKSSAFGKFISPAIFIPIVEEIGMIIPLGAKILNMACQQIEKWNKKGFFVKVAINVSGEQLESQEIIEVINQVLEDYNVKPNQLYLEITESQKISKEMISVMHAINKRGLSFYMDDFGTEYSNLRWLHQMPLYALKIDQAFVGELDKEGGDSIIVETIIHMARGLKLNIVAEGVETKNQFEILKGMGCDVFQGYYFSRPVPPEELENLLIKGAVCI